MSTMKLPKFTSVSGLVSETTVSARMRAPESGMVAGSEVLRAAALYSE